MYNITNVSYHIQIGIITLVSHSHQQNGQTSLSPDIPLETAELPQDLYSSHKRYRNQEKHKKNCAR